jgi:hypothetical protein
MIAPDGGPPSRSAASGGPRALVPGARHPWRGEGMKLFYALALVSGFPYRAASIRGPAQS